MTEIARITAIVGDHYAQYDAAHRSLREANLSSYGLQLLADFSAMPREALRAQTAAACSFASLPRIAESIFGDGRKDSTVAGLVARATICAHNGDWSNALPFLHEAASRRIEVEPAYSLAVLFHVARYLVYYGSYSEAARYLDSAAAEATATLPQWQHLIALSQCEVAARRGERTKAQLHLDAAGDAELHLRGQGAVACATLCALLDDSTGRIACATTALASEALDRSQPVVAASLLHFAATEPQKPYDAPACALAGRTLNVLPNDLAAQPFLVTIAHRCCAWHSRAALIRLDAMAAHGDAPAPRAFAALGQAFVAQRSGRREDALSFAERAARQFQAMGDVIYARTAMDFIVSERSALRTSNAPPQLTKRQAEIVALVRRGLSNRDVALHLHISEHTVERHLTAIFTRLNLRSRYQLPITGD